VVPFLSARYPCNLTEACGADGMRETVRSRRRPSSAPKVSHLHQQPDVSYIRVLEKVDFPCTVNAQHLPFQGNQLRAETG
jgi:hypothetical protein